MKIYCVKIALHIAFHKKQVNYYSQTAYAVITDGLALILPTFSRQERQKRGIITFLITGFISLAYKGIFSFLHYKRQKAIHKAVQAMENKVDLQHNKLFHLEDSMVLYGIYNSDTLETLIDTVLRLHNQSTWKENRVCGKIRRLLPLVLIRERCKPLCNKFNAFLDHCKKEICKNVWKESLLN